MTEIKWHKEIPIPKVNEYPFEKAEEWAKRGLTQALRLVNKKRAEEIKAEFPLRTAAYCEQMTFGLWRLTGPASGQVKSPLDTVLEYFKPYACPTVKPIKASEWSQFRWKFIGQLKLSFTAICNSNYDPAMVKEMNNSINQLLADFSKTRTVVIQLNFVLHPDTVEYFYSPRMSGIMSRIWERLAKIKFYLTIHPQPPPPNGPRQMEMHLDLSITR